MSGKVDEQGKENKTNFLLKGNNGSNLGLRYTFHAALVTHMSNI